MLNVQLFYDEVRMRGKGWELEGKLPLGNLAQSLLVRMPRQGLAVKPIITGIKALL